MSRISPILATALSLIATVTATSLAAQSVAAERGTGPRPLLPRTQEIALARSAAPDPVSKDATVLVLERGGYVVGAEGTNGVTCYVSRSHPESLEPHCYDEEGSKTILAMQLHRAELSEQHKSQSEIDAAIAEGLRSGRFRLPSRPAMSYMMSAGQVLYNDEGRRVGSWKPHLMIYVPYITNAQLGLGSVPSTEAALVVDEGTPWANIMVVVEEFVQPKAVP